MKNNKAGVPASVRIAFVVFLALGFIITGALWMRGNEMRKQNDILAEQATSMAEENARKEELIEASMDEDYAQIVLPEHGYQYPGEEFFLNEVEKQWKK